MLVPMTRATRSRPQPADRTGHLVVETGDDGEGHAREAGVEGRQGPGQGLERSRNTPQTVSNGRFHGQGLESGATLLEGARHLLNVRAESVPDGESRHGEGHWHGRIAHRSSHGISLQPSSKVEENWERCGTDPSPAFLSWPCFGPGRRLHCVRGHARADRSGSPV